MPSKQQLILLVNSLCKLQDKILSVKGMPKHIQQPIADKVEPLKAPMFFLWEKLSYGSPTELSARGINGYWMASFHTSPPPVFVNGTPKSFEAVFFDQVIDGLLVFIHLHDGRPLPPGLWKRIC